MDALRKKSRGQEGDFAVAGDDGETGHVEEEAVLHHAYDGADGGGEGCGILDYAAVAIEDQIAFVGDVVRASWGVADLGMDS